jgi:hypothetical protein
MRSREGGNPGQAMRLVGKRPPPSRGRTTDQLMTTETARRFCAQAASFEAVAMGYSLP